MINDNFFYVEWLNDDHYFTSSSEESIIIKVSKDKVDAFYVPFIFPSFVKYDMKRNCLVAFNEENIEIFVVDLLSKKIFCVHREKTKFQVLSYNPFTDKYLGVLENGNLAFFSLE